MLPCPKCGHDNELGRIFCHGCGTKLDLSQIKAPGQGGRFGKGKGLNLGKIFSMVIRLVIVAAVVWWVYLIIQVPKVSDITFGSADTASVLNKRDQLEAAVKQKTATEITVTEADVAAWGNQLKMQTAEGSGIRVAPSKIQIRFGEDTVTGIIIGNISIGSWKKDLYIRYTGRPVIQGGHFTTTPVSGQIGEMPINLWVLNQTSFVQNYFSQLFGSLEERQLVDQLASVTATSGKAVLKYQPK